MTRLLFAAALVALVASPSSATVIPVTSAADGVVQDGNCTLREAVRAANTDTAVDACPAGSPDGDAVSLAAIAGQTITLTGGQIDITDTVVIGAPLAGGQPVTILANGASRIFRATLGAGKRVSLAGLILRGGRAPLGGAVYIVGDSDVTDVTFDENVATVSGGALYVGVGVHTVTRGTFAKNRATGETVASGGGGVFNDGGTLTISESAFSGNEAAFSLANGGAVLNTGTLTVTLSGFATNLAARAGGAIETSGVATIIGGTFAANEARINGGAVHLSGSASVTITDGTMFMGNTALGEGGALWNSAAGTLSVTDAEFEANTAAGADADQGGGAVYSDGGTTAITGASFAGNRATGASGSGGAVLTKGSLAADKLLFENNTSVRAGGAIEVAAASGVVLTGVTVRGNDAGQNPGFGGGLHISGDGTVAVLSSLFEANTAVEGGGIWKAGPATLDLNLTNFVANVATGDGADQGGGGLFNDGPGGKLVVLSAEFIGNRATGAAGSGGGLFNNAGAETSLIYTYFEGNSAPRAGGAIEDNAGARLSIRESVLNGNTAGLNGTAAPGNGGGIHLTGAGTVDLSRVAVRKNRSANEGGGLWNSGAGSLALSFSEISGNDSGVGGGVFQVAGAGTLTVSESLFGDNEAKAAGGGIAVDGGTATVQNTTLSANRAGTTGGGIAARGGTVRASGTTVALNSAQVAGGGVFAAGTEADSVLTLDNTIVALNTAPVGADVAGTVLSDGYNLFAAIDGGTVVRADGAGPDLTGVDPLLLPLADNGGPTLTHAVALGSPAIGAGRSTLTTDQRGVVRQTPSTIGAFEFTGIVATEVPAALEALGLSAAAPNPFRSQTILRANAAEGEAVEVVLYDALGRRIETLYAGTPGGAFEVSVNARTLPAGVYVVQMTSASAQTTQRVTVLR